MRYLILSVLILTAAGCATKKSGVSRHDPYESATVDEMVGNNVSGQVFERTLVCLNARRECHAARLVTNTVLAWATNVSLSVLTNRTVTLVRNESRTLATNTVPSPPATPQSETAAAPPDVGIVGSTNVVAGTNAPDAVANTNSLAVAEAPATVQTNQTTAVPPSTNDTHTAGSNVSSSTAGNQTVTTVATQLQSSHQVTVTTNNLSITTADNEFVSMETNDVVSTITNQTIVPVTNVTVSAPDGLECDYFLSLELTPPLDFTPVSGGESLVLSIDGVRHGFSAATPQAGFNPRRGFTTTFYKATPEIFGDIANANEVLLRVKGVNGSIERKMNAASRANFRKFVEKSATGYKAPGPAFAPVQPSS